MVGKRGSLVERFEAKFEKGAEDRCWIWQASDNGAGYGMIWDQDKRRKVLATRVSYEVYKGPISDADLVLHSCDNPKCVNPAHLRLGSYKDNVADMDKRKRRVTNTPFGEANCNAILTDAQVIQMRLDYVAGEPIDTICDRYGIARESINDFTSGRSWKHLIGAEGSPSLEDLKAEAARRRRNNARIDASIAAEIRARLASGELGKNLAVEYGLHKATISDIKLRKIWAD